MKKTLFIIFLFSSIAATAAEPTIKLRMDVSPRDITIGDPVECNITVIYSSSLKSIPLQSVATGAFELLGSKPAEIKRLPTNEIQLTHSLLLTAFSTGTIPLQSFTLNFVTENGERVEAKTQTLDIHVNSLLEKYGDEGQLRPLKGLFNFRSYFWLWLILLTLLSVALIWLGTRYWKRRHRLTAETFGPRKPPEEIAWDALHKLEDSELLSSGLVKEYYVRLSGILRMYLENRFAISSLERTTSELLIEIRRLNLTAEASMALRIFIENGDLVKFAKFTPAENEIIDDLNRVKEFVTRTTPAQEPIASEAISV